MANMYLYNGVELPDINEVRPATLYRHACILRTGSIFRLYFTSKPVFYGANYYAIQWFTGYVFYDVGRYVEFRLSEGAWIE